MVNGFARLTDQRSLKYVFREQSHIVKEKKMRSSKLTAQARVNAGITTRPS